MQYTILSTSSIANLLRKLSSVSVCLYVPSPCFMLRGRRTSSSMYFSNNIAVLGIISMANWQRQGRNKANLTDSSSLGAEKKIVWSKLPQWRRSGPNLSSWWARWWWRFPSRRRCWGWQDNTTILYSRYNENQQLYLWKQIITLYITD